MEGLGLEVEELKNRNKRVEADKAWETSLFRKTIILFLTYIVAVIFMQNIGVERAFINALIPTLGYLLSIQTIPFAKKWWIKNIYKNN